MTEDQELHAKSISENISKAVIDKYAEGQKEHGGNLWQKPLRREISQELTDFICYWKTMDPQLASIRQLLIEIHESQIGGRSPVSLERITEAIRLLE